MGILSWIVLGAIAGFLANMVVGGRRPGRPTPGVLANIRNPFLHDTPTIGGRGHISPAGAPPGALGCRAPLDDPG